MPIRAVHIARKLDLVPLFQRFYMDCFQVQHFLQQDSLVLRLQGEPLDRSDSASARLAAAAVRPVTSWASNNSSTNGSTDTIIDTSAAATKTETETCSEGADDEQKTTTTLHLPGAVTSRRAMDKWVVYFDYGAVVFFNCDAALTSKLMEHARGFCQDVFPVRGHDEEMLLVANPAIVTSSELGENHLVV